MALRGQNWVSSQARVNFPPGAPELDKALRAKLDDKRKRYGKLDHPLVVAINALNPSFVDVDYFQVLLEAEQWLRGASNEREMSDDKEAVFRHHNDVDLSAVIFFTGLIPDTFHNVEPVVIHNHRAANTLASGIPRLKNVWRSHTERGDSLSAILGLPSGWPGAAWV